MTRKTEWDAVQGWCAVGTIAGNITGLEQIRGSLPHRTAASSVVVLYFGIWLVCIDGYPLACAVWTVPWNENIAHPSLSLRIIYVWICSWSENS